MAGDKLGDGAIVRGAMMAAFYRSIRIKIFSIAVGLLIVMLIVSIWSATAINVVNRQLATAAEALVPLTLRIQNLRNLAQQEHAILEVQGGVRGEDGRACTAAFAAKAAAARVQLREAGDFVRKGQAMAVAERNKIELARLEPLLAQIGAAHDRYVRSASRRCTQPGLGEAHRDSAEDGRAFGRLVENLSDETSGFVVQALEVVEEKEQGAIRANAILIATASFVGLLLAYLVSGGLTRPIARLRDGARSVEAGRLDADVPVTSRDEIGDVTRAFNDMLAELRAKERIKETFGQYVDPRVVSQLIDGNAGQATGGTKQLASLFFSDIAGFTPIAERLAPATLVSLVNAYFATMSVPIRERQGIIDKYIGDAIMAFWTPPFVEAGDHALLACQAALAQFELLDDFRARLPDIVGLRRDVPVIDIRVAVVTGEVVAGSIGPDFARSFTVMGDTVNFGARLEGANKLYGTRILIDGDTARMAGDAIAVRELDMIQVVGRTEFSRMFELVAEAGGTTPIQQEVAGHYAAGLAAYRAGDWAGAAKGFETALAADPDDGPARIMLDRTRLLAADPPPSWNGVWGMKHK